MTQAERITALEVKVADLQSLIISQNNKIDELIALKYKGMGAFWLASALIGSGIVGAASWLVHLIGR